MNDPNYFAHDDAVDSDTSDIVDTADDDDDERPSFANPYPSYYNPAKRRPNANGSKANGTSDVSHKLPANQQLQPLSQPLASQQPRHQPYLTRADVKRQRLENNQVATDDEASTGNNEDVGDESEGEGEGHIPPEDGEGSDQCSDPAEAEAGLVSASKEHGNNKRLRLMNAKVDDDDDDDDDEDYEDEESESSDDEDKEDEEVEREAEEGTEGEGTEEEGTEEEGTEEGTEAGTEAETDEGANEEEGEAEKEGKSEHAGKGDEDEHEEEAKVHNIEDQNGMNGHKKEVINEDIHD